VDEFVPDDCLIATSTNDGGGDERKAAFQFVKEGNDLWCVCHLIQLCIGDILDSEKVSVSQRCAHHRTVLKKCHDLVVLINGHRDILRAFEVAAEAKRKTGEGLKNYDSLIIDQDTRWDSDLMMMERLVYFDGEIRMLYENPVLRIDDSCLLTKNEFDLVRCMIHLLEPIREFTKEMQHRNKITLAYVPGSIDMVITKLNFESFRPKFRLMEESVLLHAAAFSEDLIASIKTRFSGIFLGGSMALAARFLIPGSTRMTFQNFNVTNAIMDEVKQNMIDDLGSLLPSNTTAEDKEDILGVAAGTLTMAINRLNRLDVGVDPLAWWPAQNETLSILFPLAKMLLAIPATSADNERSFSSAGFTLGPRRTRLDLEIFRSEHRIRRFFVAGTSQHSKESRQEKLARLNDFLDHYAALVAARPQ